MLVLLHCSNHWELYRSQIAVFKMNYLHIMAARVSDFCKATTNGTLTVMFRLQRKPWKVSDINLLSLQVWAGTEACEPVTWQVSPNPSLEDTETDKSLFDISGVQTRP